MTRGPRKTENPETEPETKTSDTKPEPEVTVFGEHVQSRYWDDRNHGSGGAVWGVFLIVAGLVLIGNALGIIPWDFWHHVWQFWPVLLVLWGINVILGNNPFSRLVLFILALISFGLIAAYGLKTVNSPLANNFPKSVNDFVNWVSANRHY